MCRTQPPARFGSKVWCAARRSAATSGSVRVGGPRATDRAWSSLRLPGRRGRAARQPRPGRPGTTPVPRDPAALANRAAAGPCSPGSQPVACHSSLRHCSPSSGGKAASSRTKPSATNWSTCPPSQRHPTTSTLRHTATFRSRALSTRPTFRALCRSPGSLGGRAGAGTRLTHICHTLLPNSADAQCGSKMRRWVHICAPDVADRKIVTAAGVGRRAPADPGHVVGPGSAGVVLVRRLR